MYVVTSPPSFKKIHGRKREKIYCQFCFLCSWSKNTDVFLWEQITALENNRAYLLRTEITKSHLNNGICQYCGMKTSAVTPSFYYMFNISSSCNINIPSFFGNLWWVLLLENHLNKPYHSGHIDLMTHKWLTIRLTTTYTRILHAD